MAVKKQPARSIVYLDDEQLSLLINRNAELCWGRQSPAPDSAIRAMLFALAPVYGGALACDREHAQKLAAEFATAFVKGEAPSNRATMFLAWLLDPIVKRNGDDPPKLPFKSSRGRGKKKTKTGMSHRRQEIAFVVRRYMHGGATKDEAIGRLATEIDASEDHVRGCYQDAVREFGIEELKRIVTWRIEMDARFEKAGFPPEAPARTIRMLK